MWQYVFSLVKRQRSKSLLAGSGFLLAACALILLSATTQTTVVEANQIINQSWRPAYDLVVLPSQAHVTGNTIPPDLLSGFDGAISMQQYQQIKQLPGIEVAAPIAMLGYVQYTSPIVAFSSTPLSSGYYRIDWTLTAFNGKQSLVERQQSQIYYVPASCDSDAIIQKFNSNTVLSRALAKQNVLPGDCGFNGGPQTFPTIDTGPFLLAAIDPQQENQLVN